MYLFLNKTQYYFVTTKLYCWDNIISKKTLVR